MLEFDKIESNWKTFEKLCTKLGDRSSQVKKMLSDLGERACIAPASGREEYHCAFPGGLVDHSLRVLSNARTLSKTFDFYKDLPVESIIIACLFHDWGKVGEAGKDGKDYYVEQESDWHREKLGEFYKLNKELSYMKNSLRSVFLLQHYGIHLTEDEYLAIYLNDGPADDKNKPYTMKEPKLATLVQQADYLATKMEKEFSCKS